MKKTNTDESIAINLNNAKMVGQGNYSGLLCAKCRTQSAEAYFSEHSLKTGYGIWFECQNCGNVEHISCNTMPDGFTPLRISEKFQQMDEKSWGSESQ